jgi:uncharacterized membrane protein HdeD (DUF308 family)
MPETGSTGKPRKTTFQRWGPVITACLLLIVGVTGAIGHTGGLRIFGVLLGIAAAVLGIIGVIGAIRDRPYPSDRPDE